VTALRDLPTGGPGVLEPAGPRDRIATPGHRAVTGWRLLAAVTLVLLLPVTLGALTLTYQPPEPPPTETAPSFAVLNNLVDPLTQAHMDRSGQAARMVRGLAGPTLISAVELGIALPGMLPTLVLVPREQPYSLQEVRALVPGAFIDVPGRAMAGGAVLMTANLLVPLGASLVIDTQTPDVRMLSSATGFVTLMSRGTITVAGDELHPVRLTSWDPDSGEADRDLADGRSFVLQAGGRMDADHAVFEHLGFNLGLSSGVAWNSSGNDGPAGEHIRARGDVTSSVFRENYFGAYTREAEGMRWVGNTFADNEAYGFDPHDFSNNFLVEDNVAYGNGKHGFIFSRGCSGNVLRGNYAHHNAGHGIMIDDGRSVGAGPDQSRIDASDDNRVVGNFSFGNGGSGIEIEGGTGNLAVGNRLAGNYIGVRVKNGSSATVRDNTILDNRRYGIDVLHSGAAVVLADNLIGGSWGGVNLATEDSAVLDANTITEVSAPLVIDGVAIRHPGWVENVATFVRWHPMMMLWSLLLGVPIVVAAARLATAAANHGRSGVRRQRVRRAGIQQPRVPAA
jgi:parallel beta-helix repeat protein